MVYSRSAVIHIAAEKIAGKSPCMDCPDRYPGCSGRCERFADWKDRLAKAKEPLLKQAKAESEALGFLDESYRKAVKDHRASEPKWRYTRKRGR